MGEARRRKLAGTYPAADDPMEPVRRFWSGNTLTPVEDFRAPEGTVSITMDVAGAAPSTYTIEAAKIVDLIDGVARRIEGGNYYRIVRGIADHFVDCKRRGALSEMTNIGVLCLWSALRHPQQGASMRDMVSEALRRDGKAHITWHFSPTAGLAMALAEKFVDLEALLPLFPNDTVAAYGLPREPTRQN